jgi:hypothetical protein
MSRFSRKCGSLDVSQLYGPSWSVTGIALPFFFYLLICPIYISRSSPLIILTLFREEQKLRRSLRNSIFRDLMLCSRVEVRRLLGGTYLLHLQCWRLSQARNQLGARIKQSMAVLLLGIFFNPDDWSGMFHRNAHWLSSVYTALYPRRYSSSLPLWQSQILRSS